MGPSGQRLNVRIPVIPSRPKRVYRETVRVGVSGTADRTIIIEAARGDDDRMGGADIIPSDRWKVSARWYQCALRGHQPRW